MRLYRQLSKPQQLQFIRLLRRHSTLSSNMLFDLRFQNSLRVSLSQPTRTFLSNNAHTRAYEYRKLPDGTFSSEYFRKALYDCVLDIRVDVQRMLSIYILREIHGTTPKFYVDIRYWWVNATGTKRYPSRYGIKVEARLLGPIAARLIRLYHRLRNKTMRANVEFTPEVIKLPKSDRK